MEALLEMTGRRKSCIVLESSLDEEAGAARAGNPPTRALPVSCAVIGLWREQSQGMEKLGPGEF